MKVMSIREFLRGGYRGINEMTVITNHGRPVGTWMPNRQEPKNPKTSLPAERGS